MKRTVWLLFCCFMAWGCTSNPTVSNTNNSSNAQSSLIKLIQTGKRYSFQLNQRREIPAQGQKMSIPEYVNGKVVEINKEDGWLKVEQNDTLSGVQMPVSYTYVKFDEIERITEKTDEPLKTNSNVKSK